MTDSAHIPCAFGVSCISPVDIYFLLSGDGPEVVEEVLLLKRAFTIMFEWVMFEHGTQGRLASGRTGAVGLGSRRCGLN